jgi:hypothetical protein
MFELNEKTFVNIQFKMMDLFKQIKANKDIKADASKIIAVKLTNILSPQRMNIEPSDAVKEIYVIDIQLNSINIPNCFIEALSQSIHFQTLFCLRFKDKVKYILPIKVNNKELLKTIKTFETEWLKEEKLLLPTTTKLETVFKEIIFNVSGYRVKQSETLEEYVQRFSEIQNLQKCIDKLSRMINAENQPNKKMELNDKGKELKKQIKQLS